MKILFIPAVWLLVQDMMAIIMVYFCYNF